MKYSQSARWPVRLSVSRSRSAGILSTGGGENSHRFPARKRPDKRRGHTSSTRRWRIRIRNIISVLSRHEFTRSRGNFANQDDLDQKFSKVLECSNRAKVFVSLKSFIINCPLKVATSIHSSQQ